MAKTIVAGDVAEVRRLRRQASEMLEDLLDMTHTLVRLGEASDWTDERLPVWELALRRLEEIREALLARAREIERAEKGRVA